MDKMLLQYKVVKIRNERLYHILSVNASFFLFDEM